MNIRKTSTQFLSLGLALTALALLSVRPAAAQNLTGAGSTFVYPAMARWAADFQQAHPSVKINYQSIGSGAGIQQVRNHTVDFGASDVALSDAQLKEMPAVVQIPEVAGPVCIAYNLPMLHQPLKLTPAALSGIYLGTITRWNDPAIAQSNPGVNLPGSAVLVAHRSDGSGTTGIFTTYLATVNGQWKQRVGSGISVNWPVGLGGKGNEGVTGVIKQVAGGIGYVELAYALENHLPMAAIENASGQFVIPSPAGVAAAIEANRAVLARDVRTPIVNAPGASSYPISGFTFLILPKDGNNPQSRQALKNFVAYILAGGQATAAALHYSPIPAAMQVLDRKLLAQLTVNGKPLR